MSREENMSKWTLEEKKCLLDTLQKVGCKNMTVLKRKLPKKTPAEIEEICNKYEEMAKKRNEEKKKNRPPIDAWIEIFHNISKENSGHPNDITARVLKYLGLFETNDNTEPVDPMIKNCYIWLAQAAQGLEPEPLDDCSSWLLEQCLVHLMKETRMPNTDGEQFIYKLHAVPRQNSVENPSINPLDVPTELLEIKGEIKVLFDRCSLRSGCKKRTYN
ncbi:unnamed protein product [Callosobruchus maculatus]|uniref:Myb-like domain-containing protein n=1 Tax=Callosobruchus maculatus TaxID=64391 RepID=A0A653DTI3_CALMS|nr:unnamed protein product [Callosobruchus maculatus]